MLSSSARQSGQKCTRKLKTASGACLCELVRLGAVRLIGGILERDFVKLCIQFRGRPALKKGCLKISRRSRFSKKASVRALMRVKNRCFLAGPPFVFV